MSSSGSLWQIWEALVEKASGLSRRTLAWGGLLLGAVSLLCFNVISDSLFRTVKSDLSAERLYTISSGTRKVLSEISEPITLRVYYSKGLSVAAPSYGRYFDRVRTLLQQYRDISGNKLVLEFIDPEPFSDAEDRAVAAGLRGVRINREGETAYFGLAGFNMTDHNAVIEFFAPEREPFLEYDISKLIYSLANPKKRVVGLVTTLPVNGRFMPQGGTQPPWHIMEQMRDFFEVKEIAADAKEIPVDVDVLLIAQPEKVADDLLYAIDQYALKGGRILALVDPVSEAGGPGPMGMLGPFGETSSLDRLLTAWGVSFDQKKFAGDLKHARRVQFGGAGAPVITEYLAWLSLDRSNLDTTDVLAGGIERLNFGTAGILKRTEKATTKFQPLVTTSKQAMAMDAESLKFRPDPVALLRSYKPGTEPLVLAARITGEASTAFPEGPPKPPAERAAGSDAKPADAANAAGPAKPAPEVSKPPAAKSGNLNVVVIADSDFLHEQFWAETREAGGQKLVIPTAQNAALLLNAIEHLSGGEVLSGLRGKGVQDRPFDLVDSIRRDSERQFREKEQLLMTKLRNVQQQLSSIETKSDGNVVLSDKDRQAIDSFRREMLDIRRELRDVKHGLRKDIDRVDGIVKFANIAAVPILIALGGAFVAWRRRRPSSRSAGSVA